MYVDVVCTCVYMYACANSPKLWPSRRPGPVAPRQSEHTVLAGVTGLEYCPVLERCGFDPWSRRI